MVTGIEEQYFVAFVVIFRMFSRWLDLNVSNNDVETDGVADERNGRNQKIDRVMYGVWPFVYKTIDINQ